MIVVVPFVLSVDVFQHELFVRFHRLGYAFIHRGYVDREFDIHLDFRFGDWLDCRSCNNLTIGFKNPVAQRLSNVVCGTEPSSNFFSLCGEDLLGIVMAYRLVAVKM